jgi:diacylglycerol kinase family enzyme
MKELAGGTHVQRPEVTVLRGRDVRIDADRPLPVYGDGESLTDLPMTATIRAGGLAVLVPPAGA